MSAERPARSVLEIVSSAVGCFATNELTWMIRPQLALAHARQDEPRQPEDVEEDDVDPLAPLLFGQVEEPRGRRPAAVRDEDVDLAEALDGRGVPGFEVFGPS